MKLTMTELHFPRAPWRFNLSNLLEHYARGRRGASRPFAAACSSLWYPRPRVFVSQSVKKANTATPTHISYPAASRQLHTRPRHHGDEMVPAPIPLCFFVSSVQRTRVLSRFFPLPHHACRLYARRASRHLPPYLHRHGRTTLSLISRPPSPLESAQPASHPNAQMHKSATSPNMPCGHTAVGR